jgi:hypothetical protein
MTPSFSFVFLCSESAWCSCSCVISPSAMSRSPRGAERRLRVGPGSGKTIRGDASVAGTAPPPFVPPFVASVVVVPFS